MFRGLHFSACFYIDRFAVGHYRMLFVNQALSAKNRNRRILESPSPIRDYTFLGVCDSIRVQRLSTKLTKDWFDDVRKSFSDKRIIYDVDDILIYEDIPDYNMYKNGFIDSTEHVKYYMENSDIVTVSTKYLKEYYINKLGIPENKFVVIPNLYPRYFFTFNEDLSMKNYDENRKRPRICFSSSTSHSNIYNKELIEDDFASIEKWIVDNRKKYQFVFQGAISKGLLKYSSDFQSIPCVPFLYYPKSREQSSINLMIQPLQDNIFNRCKSELKIHEPALSGIPSLVTALPNYVDANKEATFGSIEELDYKIGRIFSSRKSYRDTILRNYNISKKMFLEDNISLWEKVIDAGVKNE